jgi:hypothetical protein
LQAICVYLFTSIFEIICIVIIQKEYRFQEQFPKTKIYVLICLRQYSNHLELKVTLRTLIMEYKDVRNQIMKVLGCDENVCDLKSFNVIIFKIIFHVLKKLYKEFKNFLIKLFNLNNLTYKFN